MDEVDDDCDEDDGCNDDDDDDEKGFLLRIPKRASRLYRLNCLFLLLIAPPKTGNAVALPRSKLKNVGLGGKPSR